MEKKHLYVLVIAAIFGLMLILPASAAISFQKYSPTGNTMYKPVATPIPSFPFKNVPVIVQPQLIPWKQTPGGSQIPVSPGLFNKSAIINTFPTGIPIYLPKSIRPSFFTVTLTVWNADHTKTVPGASVEFIETWSNSGGVPSGVEICAMQIATGTTDSNGKLTTNIHINPDADVVTIQAKGPVISENGEQVYISVLKFYRYKSHSIDIPLDERYRLVQYPNGISFWSAYL